MVLCGVCDGALEADGKRNTGRLWGLCGVNSQSVWQRSRIAARGQSGSVNAALCVCVVGGESGYPAPALLDAERDTQGTLLPSTVLTGIQDFIVATAYSCDWFKVQ